MTTKTIEKKVNVLSKEIASLRSLVTKALATDNVFEADSFDNYKNPRALKASLKRAIKDWQIGRVVTKL